MVAWRHNRSIARVILPIGDVLQARGSVGALGGVDAGGNLLLNRGVDGIVDKDDVNSGGIGAVMC